MADDTDETTPALPLEEWRRKLVADNIRLVKWWASRYKSEDQEELHSLGYLGMCEAAARFDPQRGVKFSSYAMWWVRAYIFEHIRSKGLIRVGTTREAQRVMSRLRRARAALGPDRENDYAALAEIIGVDAEIVEHVALSLSKKFIVSVDEQVEGHRPLDLLDEKAFSEEQLNEEHDNTNLLVRLEQALDILDQREREIVKARHNSGEPTTLADLGERFKISRERVRQIETRAIKKITAFMQSDSLSQERRLRRMRNIIFACKKCKDRPRVKDSPLCRVCRRNRKLRIAKQAREHRKKIEQRRAEGSCVRCGIRPVSVGTDLCEVCR